MSDGNGVAVKAFDTSSIQEMRDHLEFLKSIIHEFLVEGEDYGVIPGTKKFTLLQPGAQKLAKFFKISNDYKITITEYPNGHRDYRLTCRFTNIVNGVFVGSGVGSCSTLETKYRYRKHSEEESTDIPVPKNYWDRKSAGANFEELNKILGSAVGSTGNYKTKKVDNAWIIYKKTGNEERIENPDIADSYNTVLKIAKKRSYVDGVLTVTCGFHLFTQDMEDFVDLATGEVVEKKPGENKTSPTTDNKTQNGNVTTSGTSADSVKEKKASMRQNLVDRIKADGIESVRQKLTAEIARHGVTTEMILKKANTKDIAILDEDDLFVLTLNLKSLQAGTAKVADLFV